VWLECDFGITDWGGRPYPQPYMSLAYQCDAPWNSTHLCDEELDALSKAAGSELDHEKRVEFYHQIQEVFTERGGAIIPFFQQSILAHRNNLINIKPASLAAAVDLRRVYLAEE
jgi:peptide/nickel transport system substrate-binding protein